MKKYLALFLICGLISLPAAAIKLNNDSKKEAALLMDFINAVYQQDANTPQAFDAYLKMLQQAPDSPYLKRQAVAAALAENRIKEAAPYADFITPESDAEDYTVHAAYLWKTGNIPEAEKEYEKALSLAPDDSRIFYQYILLLSYAHPDKAVTRLEEYAVLYPQLAPYAYMEIGNLYMARANFTEAQNYYDKAVQTDPELAAARIARASVYERQGQYLPMRQELLTAEELGAASAPLYRRIASSFWLEQNNTKAEEYFLKAKKLDNTDLISALALTELARKRGDLDQAIAFLRDAPDFDTNVDRWTQTAALLHKQGNLTETARLLGQAYKKFDNNMEVGFLYALVLRQTNQHKKALKVLNNMLAIQPDYDDARLTRATTYECLGRYALMEKDTEFLLAKNPKNPYAINLKAYGLAQRGIRLQEAEKLAVYGLTLRPGSEAALDTLAWIYFKQGRLEEAGKLLLSLPPDLWQQEPELAYHYGAVLFAQGRYDEARPFLDAARHTLKEAQRLYKKLPRTR